MTAREYLIKIYTEYRNDYLSVAKYAEHNGLTDTQGEILIALARSVAQSKHPEE